MAKISVLLSFYNEGDEVINTVASVRDTARDRVDIVVVDDCSDDARDYEAELLTYNVRYHKNANRMGSSAGKQKATELCATPYFIILDAHCRMYTPNWVDILESEFQKPEAQKTVYCCGCWGFTEESGEKNPKKTKTYGSYFAYSSHSLFLSVWNTRNYGGVEAFDIPCILGANYACSKEWWDYIGGHKGLYLYGREEPFVSIKSKMAGGYVKCLPSLITGHKYRTEVKDRQYPCWKYEGMHNEMVIAYVCIPHLYPKLMRYWEKAFKRKPHSFLRAKEIFSKHIKEIESLRYDFQRKVVISFEQQEEFNTAFLKRLNKRPPRHRYE